MLLALALKTEFPQAKVYAKARNVIAYPDLMTAEQITAYEDADTAAPFACPDCFGSGDELDEDGESIEFCGCRRCNGRGFLSADQWSGVL